MSYQVLARKWRPKNFQELRGQEHVSRALVNAIESGRLHHAYLFTGTRGVGKTTIARILSKCLNCETNGITATPCGECGSCSEIDEGRFVDLIEVDAASRTKVDDTRELLENVQYRPTRGRYKVYLIDEVHMLSNSSFNALLKTLEEPPEHVIFLLATTDPQKLPVTVLSRCLQFHLKHMDEETIAGHLQFILQQESLDFEEVALQLIAQSAEGSMRDALSLLDQAIAYGQGKVLEEDIRTMLGTIDHKFMVRLLEALASRDSVMAIKAVDDMSHYPVDFADALKELLSRLHQIAIYQATDVLLDSAASYVAEFAKVFEAADLQMYYQLGLHARRDLEWAPTAKQGLEMALLRMLAFQIDASDQAASSSTASSSKKKVSLKLSESKLSESKLSSKNVTEVEKAQPSAPSASSEPNPVTSESLPKMEEEALPKKEPVTETSKEPDAKDELSTDSAPSGSKASNSNLSSPSFSSNEKPQEQPVVENEYADYEQFFQQEEDDEQAEKQEGSGFASHSQTETPEQPAVTQNIATTRTDISGDSKSGPEEADDGLASLHSALGLNFAETDSDTAKKNVSETDSKSVTEAAPSTGASDSADAASVEPEESVKPEDAVEEYDSDIERLMQSKQEFEATAVPTETKVSYPPETREVEEEPEQIPELDAPEAAMEWANLVKKLELDGTYHQIAQSSCAIWESEQELTLELAPEQEVLLTDGAKANVKSSLESYLDKSLNLHWELKEPSVMTPAEIWQHQAKLRLQKACEDLNKHPFSVQLQQQFGAKIDRQSVTYLND